jgi:hypothetical protein
MPENLEMEAPSFGTSAPQPAAAAETSSLPAVAVQSVNEPQPQENEMIAESALSDEGRTLVSSVVAR